MIFDKHRFEVWTAAQHPLKHTLSDFAYSNNGLPGVTDVNSALNWLVKVLYPNTKPSVATPADLPLIGNTLNDYRVVLDDGDGKQAGYRWEQREGEVSASWHKIYDFDWSTDSILAAFMNITQEMYVYQKGKTDLDPSGAPIVGVLAGQHVYGGDQANQNFTLSANSGDGVGANTGFVQVTDHFRPTANGSLDIGTTALRFQNLWLSSQITLGTLVLTPGNITDSGGTIDFGATNLTTTGTITGNSVHATASVVIGSGTNMTLTPGSISDASGAINFGGADLNNITNLNVSGDAVLNDFTFSGGTIDTISGTADFLGNDILTTGTVFAGIVSAQNIIGTTDVTGGNLKLSANTLQSTNLNGNVNILASGLGVIDLQSAVTSLGQTVTGTMAITGLLTIDNLSLNGDTISTLDTNGNLILSPNGVGEIIITSTLAPNADGTLHLGDVVNRFSDLHISGSITDNTDSFAIPDLLSLRDINIGVGSGFSLFWNGTKWISSLPDTEITHNTLSGLLTGDAGHTQFALLAGRAGGQSLIGGTAASENLNLESTAHATKGKILVKDTLAPFTNASYSGSWQGTDLGGASNYFRDLYTKGEAHGLRLENFTSSTLPGSSAQNPGRVVFATDNNKIYIDNGSQFVVGGASKYLNDTSWNGILTTQTFTVSASLTDARTALWQLCDNANNFNRVYCDITPINATQVTVTASPALPAGTYRLIGIE
jgi:hypothetical protein